MIDDRDRSVPQRKGAAESSFKNGPSSWQSWAEVREEQAGGRHVTLMLVRKRLPPIKFGVSEWPV
jgi:hypothetical protein